MAKSTITIYIDVGRLRVRGGRRDGVDVGVVI